MSRSRASLPEHEATPGAAVVVTPEVAAEAAVWIARLHGPDRSSAMERECLEWQGRSEMHRHAFERCTETWLSVPRITLADAFAAADAGRSALQPPPASKPSRISRWALVLGLAALMAIGTFLFQAWRNEGAYSTALGEHRLVELDDGTRMSLNTSTRVRVRLNGAQRTVSVEGGEALFEVAKDAQRRPFIVRVAHSEVVAQGTVFVVRLTSGAARAADVLAVTLIEGSVAVRPVADDAAGGGGPSSVPLVLQAGERVRLQATTVPPSSQAATRVDRPPIDQLMAWRHGEAIFEDATLPEAIAEMNRYSRTPIVLTGGAGVSDQRVSGQFRTGDNLAFARAVAALHSLALSEREGRLELAAPN